MFSDHFVPYYPDNKYNNMFEICWKIFDPKNCPLLAIISYKTFYNMINKCCIRSFHLIAINANLLKYCVKNYILTN